jgi:hypothetical protein
MRPRSGSSAAASDIDAPAAQHVPDRYNNAQWEREIVKRRSRAVN